MYVFSTVLTTQRNLNSCLPFRLLKSHGLNWSHRVKERVDFWKAENMKSPQFLSFVVDMLAEEIEKGAENADQNMAEAQEVSISLFIKAQ